MEAGWPVVAGTYEVGDPKGPVAVCALTSERLVGPLVGLPGVAIAGIVYTANLGITRIIANITANPSIRFLLVCGRDSPLFKPGQSLVALSEHRVDGERRIVKAAGYDPVLGTVSQDKIQRFRRQVEVLDWTGEEDLEALKEGIGGLFARNPGVHDGKELSSSEDPSERFLSIRPGGQREPLLYDPKGYFVISLDREHGEIVLRHYLPDHTPAHEMRGRGATSMLLGLLREGLITQHSHAGYLGEELAKAQTALQFGFRYDQDRPLRPGESMNRTTPSASTPVSEASRPQQVAQKTPAVRQPMTREEFATEGHGSKVDLVISVVDSPGPNILSSTLLESDEAQPFNLFHRTQKRVKVEWDAKTRIIMGEASEVGMEAILRVVGTIDEKDIVRAEQLVILTKVARIS